MSTPTIKAAGNLDSPILKNLAEYEKSEPERNLRTSSGEEVYEFVYLFLIPALLILFCLLPGLARARFGIGAFPMNGSFGEIQFIARPLGDREIVTLTWQLRNKWGI